MIEQLFGTDNFNVLPHLVALVAAYALAFPIGWNREQEERSAGLRTFPACGCCDLRFQFKPLIDHNYKPRGNDKVRRRFDNWHGLHRRRSNTEA